MKVAKLTKKGQAAPPPGAKRKYDFDKRSRSENEMRELLDEGIMFTNTAAIRRHFNVKELEFLLEETQRRKLRKWAAWITQVLDEKQRS